MPHLAGRRSGLLFPPKRAIILPGSPGGSGGGGGGGSLAPAGSTGSWSISYRTTFAGTVLDAQFIPNRWSGTLPTNESTNIPSQQLDSSYSGNVVVNNGLQMKTSAQIDSASFPSWPYMGAHVTGTTGLVSPGRWVECVMRVTNRGSDWPAFVLYGIGGGPGGEIDIAEWGNTAGSGTPTWNIHPGDYHAQTGPQGFLGSPDLRGTTYYRIGMSMNTDSLPLCTPYLNGVVCGTAQRVYASTSFIITLELGVYNGSPATTTFGNVIESSEITVFAP
jgi:hypothetical protein